MNRVFQSTLALSFVAASCGSPESNQTHELMMPTEDSYAEVVIEHEPIHFAGLGFLAGYYACNGMDIEIEQTGDFTEYDVHFDWGSLPEENAILFATNLNEILDDYEQETHDRGFQNWLASYRRMRDGFSDNTDEYCVPIDGEIGF
jgi:hypothetical protein